LYLNYCLRIFDTPASVCE